MSSVRTEGDEMNVPTNHDHQHDHTAKAPSNSPAATAMAGEQELRIEGAGCASCVTKIEAALKSVPGVVSADMNFAQRTVTVTGDADRQLLIKAVEKAGGTVEVLPAKVNKLLKPKKAAKK